jgi:hypothetical protein
MNYAATHDGAQRPPRGRPIHRQRRLSDHILVAVHFACDQGELEAAEQLLAVAEFMLGRPLQEERRERRVAAQPLVAAHERLWVLRHSHERYD